MKNRKSIRTYFTKQIKSHRNSRDVLRAKLFWMSVVLLRWVAAWAKCAPKSTWGCLLNTLALRRATNTSPSLDPTNTSRTQESARPTNFNWHLMWTIKRCLMKRLASIEIMFSAMKVLISWILFLKVPRPCNLWLSRSCPTPFCKKSKVWKTMYHPLTSKISEHQTRNAKYSTNICIQPKLG